MDEFIPVIGKGVSMYKSLRSIWSWAKGVRVKILLDTIQAELEDGQSLSKASLNEIISGSHTKEFREIINTAVTNAIMAESTLGVRVNAIMVAKFLKSEEPLSYQSIRMIRATQFLCDYEIIFAKKLYQEYLNGNFPAPEGNTEEERDQKKTLVQPKEDFWKLLNEDPSEFTPKVQNLKNFGILADNPHGFYDSTGGWGYAKITDNTRLFYESIIKAEGYEEFDYDSIEEWEKAKRE